MLHNTQSILITHYIHILRAAIRIQWTKLKTVPIQLQLDEILVELETCEELRDPSTSPPGVSPPGPGTGAYGFTDKVRCCNFN